MDGRRGSITWHNGGREVGAQINRTVRAVIGHRCELGIPAAPRIRQNAWPSERLKLLGTMPDEDKKLVRRLKRTYDAIAMRRQKLNIPPCRPNRWRPEADRILGTRPDEQVAMLLGRRLPSRARRCELGKVAWVGERRPPGGGPKKTFNSSEKCPMSRPLNSSAYPSIP